MKIPFRPVILALSVLSVLVFNFNTVLASELEAVFSDFNEKAINGYDPVAYFKQGTPVKGKKDFHYRWMEASWYFSSQQNLDDFIKTPNAYAPQYGGYCAWAVSRGYTASTSPDAWRIYSGKLYLNYSLGVRKLWIQDIPGNIRAGDKNWSGFFADN